MPASAPLSQLKSDRTGLGDTSATAVMAGAPDTERSKAQAMDKMRARYQAATLSAPPTRNPGSK